MQTEHWIFDFDNDGLKIKRTPPLDKINVAGIVFCCIFLFMFVFGTVMSFVFESTLFHKILFLLCCLISICFLIYVIFFEKKTELKLQEERYIIDSTGITFRSVKKTYHIDWKNVACFGFFDDISIYAKVYDYGVDRRNYSDLQICLFFSDKEYSEGKIRKKLHFNLLNHNHHSSYDLIAFEFKSNFIEDPLYFKIIEIINRYSDKNKRLDSLYSNRFPEKKEDGMMNGDVEVVFEFNSKFKDPILDGRVHMHLIADKTYVLGIHRYYGVDSVLQNTSLKGTIKFSIPEIYPHSLWVGKKIAIKSGFFTVGYATVTKIYNRLLNYEK